MRTNLVARQTMTPQTNTNSPVVLGALVLCLVLSALPGAAQALDVGPWQRVLTAHARGGNFDYAGLRADPDRLADLNRFVEAVGTMDDGESLASWLNAYNALVVHAITTRYPIDSVRDVDGFFNTVTHRVAGHSRTLDYVENQVIRPRFHDARIHVALNCGARSCPALSPRAFAARTLDRDLDRLARAAVANSRHVRVVDGGLRVSEIFFWFSADFERDAGSVVGWLKRFGGEAITALPGDAPLARLRYDWRLNATR